MRPSLLPLCAALSTVACGVSQEREETAATRAEALEGATVVSPKPAVRLVHAQPLLPICGAFGCSAAFADGTQCGLSSAGGTGVVTDGQCRLTIASGVVAQELWSWQSRWPIAVGEEVDLPGALLVSSTVSPWDDAHPSQWGTQQLEILRAEGSATLFAGPSQPLAPTLGTEVHHTTSVSPSSAPLFSADRVEVRAAFDSKYAVIAAGEFGAQLEELLLSLDGSGRVEPWNRWELIEKLIGIEKALVASLAAPGREGELVIAADDGRGEVVFGVLSLETLQYLRTASHPGALSDVLRATRDGQVYVTLLPPGGGDVELVSLTADLQQLWRLPLQGRGLLALGDDRALLNSGEVLRGVDGAVLHASDIAGDVYFTASHLTVRARCGARCSKVTVRDAATGALIGEETVAFDSDLPPLMTSNGTLLFVHQRVFDEIVNHYERRTQLLLHEVGRGAGHLPQVVMLDGVGAVSARLMDDQLVVRLNGDAKKTPYPRSTFRAVRVDGLQAPAE